MKAIQLILVEFGQKILALFIILCLLNFIQSRLYIIEQYLPVKIDSVSLPVTVSSNLWKKRGMTFEKMASAELDLYDDSELILKAADDSRFKSIVSRLMDDVEEKAGRQFIEKYPSSYLTYQKELL